MTTETQQRFQGMQPDRKPVNSRSVGPKEESGYIHGKNDEPITFLPDKAHLGDAPV